LVFLQALAAFGLLTYLFAVEPSFPVGGEGVILFLLGMLFLAFVHALYRVADGALTWTMTKSGPLKWMKLD
jgi:hypothetical protein